VADSCPKSLGLPGVICHVFHNIIQNAVEVSAPSGSVNVSVDFDADRIFVKVTDRGEGMSPQALENLFSPARVAGKVPITGHSSGFGLYLSQMLVQTQGGNITCVSEVGEGTSLTVSLPIYPSSK
jgi:two-component system, sporulation sensor kinase C